MEIVLTGNLVLTEALNVLTHGAGTRFVPGEQGTKHGITGPAGVVVVARAHRSARCATR